MRLSDLAKKIRKPANTLSARAREGKFKTTTKILEDHIYVWYIDDKEAEEFYNDFINKKATSSK